MLQAPTAESLFLVAVTTVTGVALVWLGRHIRRTQDLSLVAGARGATVADAAGLTMFVGNVTVVTGVVAVLVGLLDLLVSSPERGLLWGVYIVGTLALAGRAHRRSRWYTDWEGRSYLVRGSLRSPRRFRGGSLYSSPRCSRVVPPRSQ